MGVIMEAVMIKGCIFDLDGTLVDSLKDLAVSTNHALEACGLAPHPIENGSLTVAGPLILKNVDYNVIFLSNFLFYIVVWCCII